MLGLDKGTQEADSQQWAQTGQRQVSSVLSTLLTSLHTFNSKSASVCAVYCLLFTHLPCLTAQAGLSRVSAILCPQTKVKVGRWGGQLPIGEVVRALVIHALGPPH